jgi:serine protease AprX
MKRIVLCLPTILLLMTAAASADESCYWVFLKDKGIPAGQEQLALQHARTQLTARALPRREKSVPSLVDEYDLPVCASYVAQIKACDAKTRIVSKWLNAVSVEVDAQGVQQLRALAFVDRVEPFHLIPVRLEPPSTSPRRALDDPNYGPSALQNEICNVLPLHARGLSGRGVLLCFLDSGFQLQHQAFDSLHVLHTWDFIFSDSIVANQEGQDSTGQDLHGTAVLSTAAGYHDGFLIGPAFGADFLCAKTEWVPTETPIEEDHYVAALEWADSIGADITSSSLGYIDWYTFDQLDGHTAVTTRGVEVAAQHGILVVTAAGNERLTDWGHIMAPADADSILAVGAVDTAHNIASFSSPGPTADGRIKPDVCALGEYVFCADDHRNLTSYFYLSGTSLATPLVSGAAALVMEAHPEWTAQQVRAAFLHTASQADAPDNDYGWGIINATAAADCHPQSAPRRDITSARSTILLQSFPNPVNGQAILTLTLPHSGLGQLALFNVLGRKMWVWPQTKWNAGAQRVTLSTPEMPSGTYIVRFDGNMGTAAHKIVVLK